jgi:transglutaminase-like putative cysteine protease
MLTFLGYVLLVLVPALGVWLASSLAAWFGGRTWLVVGSGLLLFPILPVLWEVRAAQRRARSARVAEPVLTFRDRLVLRTVALNLLFLAALLVTFPKASFSALATRGDWFLDGREGTSVEMARAGLFGAASRLEWLYRALRKNPYEEQLDRSRRAKDTTEERPVPAPRPTIAPTPAPPEAETAKERAPETRERDPAIVWTGDGTPVWPLPSRLHPAVLSLSPAAESSIANVAGFIARAESDPWLRVKALHDYVADRVAYDVPALHSGHFPPQDAETVFRSHRAVCAGYAQLLAALGQATGDEIVVVPGDARADGGDVTGSGHAWNAARIGGRWALIDTTWDAGRVAPDGFTKEYGTRYLFAPPEVQGVTHFPDDARWQLRDPPLDRGEFFRQPMLRADFFAEGFELLSPRRSQVTVSGSLEVLLKNPRRRSLVAHSVRSEGGDQADCNVSNGPAAIVRCGFASPGTYRVQLFSAGRPDTMHWMVGELEVQNR